MIQLINAVEIRIEQWGTYQKQSGANRCKIVSDKGPVTLSVPIIGGREQKAFLKDVRIDHSQRWAIQHLRSIKSCYGKAPFFDHYFPMVETLLLQQHEWLIDLNNDILQLILNSLKIKQPIQLTDEFETKQWAQKNDSELIYKPYLQVFSHKNDFVPGLSVLDALFCLGPQVVHHLK